MLSSIWNQLAFKHNTMKSLLRFLPVPENFYDIKKTCNLTTTPAVIFPYTVP